VSLLSGVCWPDVLSALLASTPQLPGDVALYLAPHALLSPRHRLLAVCAVEAGPTGCVTVTGDRAIGEWLYDASRSAYRALAPAEHPGAFPRFTGWVRIDPMLPGLPLLGLAAAHAERAQEPLIVVRADLGPLIGGRTTQRAEVTIGGRHRTATLVELSQATPEAWPHELGHALDPADPRRDPVTSEAFADTLGALLLTEQPGSLAELDALIGRVETTISQTAPSYRRHGTPLRQGAPLATSVSNASTNDDEPLPAPGADSLFTFAGLNLHGWVPTVPQARE